jgi:ABC-type branched-subunit amino acid transport system ATPase component
VSAPAPVLLSAEDLVAGYVPGVDILTGCSLELREGEIVGVIGPNGASRRWSRRSSGSFRCEPAV